MRNRNLIRKPILYVLFIGLAVLLFSCSSGLASTTATLDIQGTKPLGILSLVSMDSPEALLSPSVNLPVVDTAGNETGTLTLTTAKVCLKEIKLIEGGPNANSTEEVQQDNASVDFEGPFIVDLIADMVTPTPGNATVLVGVYTEIDGILDSHPALNGSSIYLEGTYTGPTASGNVTDMPFTLSFELDDEFQLTGDGDNPVGIDVSGGITNPIIIAFRLNKWFRFDDPQTNPDSVNFADVVPTGGVIQLVINEGDTDAICAVIVSNIVSSGDFGRDINGDGQLGSDEDSDSPEEDELDE